MRKDSPTIAQVVTVHVMTDGTIRISEFFSFDDLSQGAPVYCTTPEDAIEYLDATDAFSVNPDWYKREGADRD